MQRARTEVVQGGEPLTPSVGYHKPVGKDVREYSGAVILGSPCSKHLSSFLPSPHCSTLSFYFVLVFFCFVFIFVFFFFNFVLSE